jgi:hypothetical protein
LEYGKISNTDSSCSPSGDLTVYYDVTTNAYGVFGLAYKIGGLSNSPISATATFNLLIRTSQQTGTYIGAGYRCARAGQSYASLASSSAAFDDSPSLDVPAGYQ